MVLIKVYLAVVLLLLRFRAAGFRLACGDLVVEEAPLLRAPFVDSRLVLELRFLVVFGVAVDFAV